jgi:hypothetical protein
MKRRTIARLIAVLLIGYGLAFLIIDSDATDMAHYRTLSHDALMAELAKKNKDSFDGAFLISLFLVGAITGAVEALAAIIELAMNRISPPLLPQPEPAHDVTDGGPTLHFH